MRLFMGGLYWHPQCTILMAIESIEKQTIQWFGGCASQCLTIEIHAKNKNSKETSWNGIHWMKPYILIKSSSETEDRDVEKQNQQSVQSTEFNAN